MSDTKKDDATPQSPDSIRSEAQRLLDEIKQFRAQAEEQFKAAEEARKQANSEGLFAVNAKKVCEDHATAISQLKGTVETNVTSIQANKQKSDEQVAAVTAGKATIDAELKTISERRKEVDQASQEIVKAAQTGSARVQEIETAKTAAEKALGQTTEELRAAVQARTSAESAQKETAQLFAESKTQAASVSENQKTSTQRNSEIEKLLLASQASEGKQGEIVKRLAESDEIASKRETRLAELTKELETQIQRAKDLLPGATSAGLAASFCDQKQRFAVPQKRWLRLFITCMVLLGIVAIPSFLAAVFPTYFAAVTPDGKPNWSETFHGMVMRLPILIPLIWLAIYAGRNYMLSVRLEEDYAYKEAISRAFEGYRREMASIVAGDATNPTPLNKLCMNILTAIARRPGIIYEHGVKDITVTNEALAALDKVKELGQRQISTR